MFRQFSQTLRCAFSLWLLFNLITLRLGEETPLALFESELRADETMSILADPKMQYSGSRNFFFLPQTSNGAVYRMADCSNNNSGTIQSLISNADNQRTDWPANHLNLESKCKVNGTQNPSYSPEQVWNFWNNQIYPISSTDSATFVHTPASLHSSGMGVEFQLTGNFFPGAISEQKVLNGNATVTSTDSPTNSASRAVDDNIATYWRSVQIGAPSSQQFITITFPNAFNAVRVQAIPGVGMASNSAHRVYVGSSASSLVQICQSVGPGQINCPVPSNLQANVKVVRIRSNLTSIAAGKISWAEVEIFQNINTNANFSSHWTYKQATPSSTWIRTLESKIESSPSHPWILHYAPYAQINSQIVYPGSMNKNLTFSAQVKFTRNITATGTIRPYRFGFPEILACWKRNGTPCTAYDPIPSDPNNLDGYAIARFYSFDIEMNGSISCKSNYPYQCPPFHYRRNGDTLTAIPRALTPSGNPNPDLEGAFVPNPNYPYSAYSYYCKPHIDIQSNPIERCSPFGQNAQEIIQLAPHPEWAPYGLPETRPVLGTPYSLNEAKLGLLWDTLYKWGTSPRTIKNADYYIGPEVFADGTKLTWETQNFDIKMPKGNLETIGYYEPLESKFYFKNSLTAGTPDGVVQFGQPDGGYKAIVGDWNGDSISTIGLFHPQSGAYFLKDQNDSSPADYTFSFGTGGPAIQPITGDWDGDGRDSIGFYDPSSGYFYLKNDLNYGNADFRFYFKPSNQQSLAIAGDWDGDGIDTVGVYAPGEAKFYLRNEHLPGNADQVINFGNSSSAFKPVVGDWNGDRITTIGFFDPGASNFFLRNSHTPGPASISFPFGTPNANPPLQPISGKWGHLVPNEK